MNGDDKPIVWLEGEIKTPPLSREARIEAGTLLRRLQNGENMGLPHSRPMSSIGRRCHELRIHDNMKLALASKVKERRQQLKITQQELAKRLGSSQSRVAKMEVADRSVSMELLVRSLASLGATRTEIGRIIGARGGARMRPNVRKTTLAKQ